MTVAASAAPGARPSLTPTTAASALALMMGLQPATTDIYLPALPALTKSLAAPMVLAQLTMSALILAFGFGQLFWGPVADRVGRRPALITSLLLYAVAAWAAVLADSIEMLVVCRTLQGFAMAGSVVCARAMVRDLYEPGEGARMMTLASTGIGVIAIIGPVLGGVVAAAWGWRGALAVVATFGLVVLGFVLARVPESLPLKDPHATRVGPMLRNWARIARHPTFIAWTLLVACTYGGLYTFLAGGAFVFIDVLGQSAATYGVVLAAAATSFLIGTLLCRRFIRLHGPVGAVGRGAVVTLIAALSMAALASVGSAPPWVFAAAQCLYSFGHAFHTPCGQAGAVAAFPRNAGAASSLAGFVMALVAFGIGRWLALALDGGAQLYLWTIAFWALLTAVLAWTLVRRHGMP